MARALAPFAGGSVWGLLLALAGDWRRQVAPLVPVSAEADWLGTADLVSEVVTRLFPSSLVLLVFALVLAGVAFCFGGCVGFVVGRFGWPAAGARSLGNRARLRAYLHRED